MITPLITVSKSPTKLIINASKTQRVKIVDSFLNDELNFIMKNKEVSKDGSEKISVKKLQKFFKQAFPGIKIKLQKVSPHTRPDYSKERNIVENNQLSLFVHQGYFESFKDVVKESVKTFNKNDIKGSVKNIAKNLKRYKNESGYLNAGSQWNELGTLLHQSSKTFSEMVDRNKATYEKAMNKLFLPADVYQKIDEVISEAQSQIVPLYPEAIGAQFQLDTLKMYSKFGKDISKEMMEVHKTLNSFTESKIILDNNRFTRDSFKKTMSALYDDKYDPDLKIAELKYLTRAVQNDRDARLRSYGLYNCHLKDNALEEYEKVKPKFLEKLNEKYHYDDKVSVLKELYFDAVNAQRAKIKQAH